MIDVLLAILIIAFFICIRKEKNKSDYLSKDKCLALRGILSIFIVIHHLTDNLLYEGFLFYQFRRVGYFIVAIFFFLSGYGLMLSYLKKGRNYFKGYWKNRIGYLFIVYFLTAVLYTAYHNIFIKSGITLETFIKSFYNSETIVSSSWYIIVQLLFYILFWIAFCKLDKSKVKLGLLIISILVIAIMFAFHLGGYPTYWYLSDIAFIIGIAYAFYKERIDILLKNHYWIVLSASALLFALIYVLPTGLSIIGIKTGLLVYILSRNITTAVFAVFIAVLFYRFDIKGKIWRFLGGISLEIYLLHGLVIMIIDRFTDNDTLKMILVVIITVAAATIANYINKYISKAINWNKKSTNIGL